MFDSYNTRDKYGRSVTHFTVNGKTVAVVVCLPKHYAEKHGHRYLVNDWASAVQGDVTYFVKRKDAVNQACAVVDRVVKSVSV